MTILEAHRNPSRRDLLLFGWALPLFAALAGTLVWRAHAPAAARAVWIAGATLSAAYLMAPRIRKPVYVGWMLVAFPIGYVVSHVILALVYYGVFTPIGVGLRLLGRDPMTRRFEPAAPSYWVEHDPHGNVKRYLRQF